MKNDHREMHIKMLLDQAKDVQKRVVSLEKDTKQRAADAFKNHQLEVIENSPDIQIFECRNESKSWNYGFRVITSDNTICLTGDVGELLVTPGYNREGLYWMLGSIHDFYYFKSKFADAYFRYFQEFDKDTLIVNVASYIPDDLQDAIESFSQEIRLLERCLGEEFETPEQYYTVAYSELGIDEPTSPFKIKSGLWYRYEALKKFCALVREKNFKIKENNT